MQMLNPWLAFSLQAARLGWEAQNVMAFRLMRLAGEGAADKVPRPRTAVAVKGGNGRGATKKVTRVPKKRIRWNKRRVSK
jgi:hypothetical protein